MARDQVHRGAPSGGRQRLVVKIGTNTLAADDGTPDAAYIRAMANELVGLRDDGHEFLIVSSGAIGAGKGLLGLGERVREVRVRQALAAAGQPLLMEAWSAAFERHDVRVAQLLLTHHSFTNRQAYLNLRNATEALLELGIVPIINENDTVSIDEIDASFGDNDRLSAYVASKVEADLLIILSDVAGLYTRPPGTRGAELVPVVEAITDEVEAMAGARPGSGVGRGGMTSKLDAARTATRAGVPVVIADGREPQVVSRVLAGESLGTRFLEEGSSSLKEHWLEIAKPAGTIDVDDGAAKALAHGRHLLPAGVTGVSGSFPAGSVVEIRRDGKLVAKAVSSYSAKELELVKGKKSSEVKESLGRDGQANVTRKNNIVVF